MFSIQTVEKETSIVPENVVITQSTMSTYQPGQYIAAVYDRDLYIGLITELSDECEDVKVRFMNRSKRSGMLTWPRLDDICWIPFQHILGIIPAPEAYGRGARMYKLQKNTNDAISRKFDDFARVHFV